MKEEKTVIERIFIDVSKYILDPSGPAKEIRMHPSVFQDCMSCPYNEVILAFNLNTQQRPSKMFSFPLAVDSELEEGEWKVQTPRFKQ